MGGTWMDLASSCRLPAIEPSRNTSRPSITKKGPKEKTCASTVRKKDIGIQIYNLFQIRANECRNRRRPRQRSRSRSRSQKRYINHILGKEVTAPPAKAKEMIKKTGKNHLPLKVNQGPKTIALL